MMMPYGDEIIYLGSYKEGDILDVTRIFVRFRAHFEYEWYEHIGQVIPVWLQKGILLHVSLSRFLEAFRYAHPLYADTYTGTWVFSS